MKGGEKMPNPNFNHFTGKTKSFKTEKRKKKIKNKHIHKNKYAKYSTVDN